VQAWAPKKAEVG